MSRFATATAAAVTVASLALFGGTGCGGPNAKQGGPDSSADTKITFMHSWTEAGEVKVIDGMIDTFERTHPRIKVTVVPGADEDKIKDALRRGGKPPDVISSLSSDNLGLYCAFKVFTDLGPFLEKSKIIPDLTMSRPMVERNQYEGTQCALPLLGDSYGLYYNKDAFKEAGIEAPPKTFSEFATVAKKLTKASDTSFERVGFMPLFNHYENTPSRFASQWNPIYFGLSGKSNTALDPSFAEMFQWQKDLVDDLGGYRKLERFRSTFGDEWGDTNAFHTGQVAMQLDGEWRLGMLKDADVDFEFGVAPLPVPTTQLDSYGKGPVSGSMIAIPTGSKKKNAAWELVKYLTTDTDAVVTLANQIHNVPSTLTALHSSKLDLDPRFQTFMDIAEHPDSSTTPATIDGDAYQWTLHDLGVNYESGAQTDLDAGLVQVDKKVDAKIAKVRKSRGPR